MACRQARPIRYARMTVANTLARALNVSRHNAPQEQHELSRQTGSEHSQKQRFMDAH
jgi:hypothetical protein